MMCFKIGKKPLRLLFSAVLAATVLTGCGRKYEAIDLSEFDSGKITETTALSEESPAENEENTEITEIEKTEAKTADPAQAETETERENEGETESETADDAESEIAVQAEVSDTEIETNWNGHIVAIDAGHQAKANTDKEPIGPGAETMKAKMEESAVGTITGIKEYELTLTVAKKLESVLKERGYQIVMLREGNDVNLSNAERSVIANESGAEILLRLHANSMENPSVYGVLTMCMTEYNPYNASLHAESYALSKKLVDNIGSVTGTKNRGVQQVDNLSSINWSEIPVSVVEMGFLSNPDEDNWLASEEYQDKLVSGIAAAVDSYFSENP